MSYEELLRRLIDDLPKLQPIQNTIEPPSFLTALLTVLPEWAIWLMVGVVAILLIIGLFMAIMPVYSVWSSRKEGQAELARANFAEQVAIAEANARLKSANMNKEAELIEASAVADSIKIIGDSLAANEGYLRWQWIKSMAETKNEVIYVPTEANLPILEATRRKV